MKRKLDDEAYAINMERINTYDIEHLAQLLLQLQSNLNFLHEANAFDEIYDFKHQQLYEKIGEIYRQKCTQTRTLEKEIIAKKRFLEYYFK